MCRPLPCPLSTNFELIQHPSRTAGYPHLCLQNQVVIQFAVISCNTATQEVYFNFLIDKFWWNISPTTTLARSFGSPWSASRLQRSAHLKNLSMSGHPYRITTTFRVIPLTRSAHHVTKAQKQLIIFSPVPIWWLQIWKDLHDQFFKHHLQHELSNLLSFGLYHGWHAPTNIHLHHLPYDLQALYNELEANILWMIHIILDHHSHNADDSHYPGSPLSTSEWAITWRRNYFLRKNCPTYNVRILRCYLKLIRKQRGIINVVT